MAKTTIGLGDLGKAISEQLTTYHTDVVERVNAAGKKAAKALVEKTQATAPIRTGDFVESLTYKSEKSRLGDEKFTWGAKAPHHRLTHLLVKGHATPNGKRVPGDPFLENALADVLPEYEKDVQEALKNA